MTLDTIPMIVDLRCQIVKFPRLPKPPTSLLSQQPLATYLVVPHVQLKCSPQLAFDWQCRLAPMFLSQAASCQPVLPTARMCLIPRGATYLVVPK